MKWFQNNIFNAALLLGALSALGVWTLASPMGASPDDNYHLSSVWCGRGSIDGQCEVVNDSLVKVPKPLVYDKPLAYATWCYIFDRTRSAACQREHAINWSDTTMVSAPWINNREHLYPKGYYFVHSFLVRAPNLRRSALIMRVANTLLALVLWGLLLKLGRGTSVWNASMISILFVSVPVGIFIIASNNPSSWAIISQSTFWGFFYLLGEHVQKNNSTNRNRGYALWACTVCAALIGIFARADAPVFVVLVMGLTLLLRTNSIRSMVHLLVSSTLLLTAVTAILAAAIFVFFYQSQGADVVKNSLDVTNIPSRSFTYLLLQNLVSIPMLWHGAVGGWGLGWLDTLMPPVIPLLVFSIIIHFTISGLNEAWLMKRVVVGTLFLALFFIPFQILMNGQQIVGETVQPRYLLPLLYPTLGIAMLNKANLPRGPASGFVLYLVVGLLSLAHALALHVNIRRYVTGTDVFAFNLNHNIEWWWDFGPPPMTLWMTGSIGFSVLAFLLIHRMVTTSQRCTAEVDT